MKKWIVLSVMLPAIFAFAGCGAKGPGVTVASLRCEYLENPLGIDTPKPRLSWVLESADRGQAQKAYRVLVASSAEKLAADTGDLWDSGKIDSDQSIQVVYGGAEIASGAPAFWKVKAWDRNGKESPWSEPASWSMGLRSADWQAQWIGPDTDSKPAVMPPAPFFRKSFTVDKPVRRATLYLSARGLVEPSLNGERIGKDMFAPEWTDYTKRIQYRTYDVTSQVKPGENTLGVILGDGWYSGYIGWRKERGHYGLRNSLLARLEMEGEDGAKTALVSDGTWKFAEGPILSSDFMMGETYDARKEMPGWNAPGFDDASWKAAAVIDPPAAPLVAQPSEPVQVPEEVAAKEVTEPKPGVYIFNLGQNIAGWARIKVSGPAGTKLVLRFAERLNPDGTMYVTNLRAAKCTDTYILKGGGEEIWEPRFTFHGFQYVEMVGLPAKPGLDAVTGRVAYSCSPVTGSFECSNPMVNQLYSNICWGQRGNFISIPTDCPQRDERLGWMGDAQIFIRTATYNRDVAAFFTKWMQDVEDAQSAEGAYADTSPKLKDLPQFEAVAGWGDAGVVVPWTIWRAYADTRIIEKHWDSMERWMNMLLKDNPDLIRRNRLNNNYGDWLSTVPDAEWAQSSTRKVLLATGYWAYDAKLMSEMAKALGRTEDYAKYDALFQKIRAAYQKEFVQPDGRIGGESQTVYVLSLYFDLLPEDMRAKAAEYLVEDIKKNGNHLTTGFIGVRHLCPVLTQMGYPEMAYTLLNNDTYPSWGYSIKHGATTIWERWDGWTAEKGFQDPGMNSFNHYSLGSVGEWLFESVGGIDLDPEVPAYKKSVIRPVIGGGFTHAKAEYRSIYGKIASGWKLDGDKLALDVTIPANTTSTVYVPAAEGSEVTEGGKPAKKAEGLRFVKEENGYAVFEAGSGVYSFASTMKK